MDAAEFLFIWVFHEVEILVYRGQILTEDSNSSAIGSMEMPHRKKMTKQLTGKRETALYVAAEYGYAEVVEMMIKYYDIVSASIKPGMVMMPFTLHPSKGTWVLFKALSELSMTVDLSNTTALHSAAAQGHIEMVNFFLEESSNLATIAKSNGKIPLHSAARNGYLEVLKAFLSKEPEIAGRNDKGQTALHMAVKGLKLELVEELIKTDPSLINMV
ncbi:ankyrin repeat-containing protein At5g02620-like [Telopea speciosissima]|uniref:ankyrin repeat-containing protein At5g02620-like n=1 Tax=Telopea speciosissima TaxID=54955 RepID=UPI001CC45E6C|nr:ankyrin repeat-containing protein At5g02620-like [Telopea speciosissima]